MSTVSIASEQKRTLKVMLNLNNKDLKSRGEPIWRVLVYDRRCQDVIAPLLNNKELRDIGVVLHLFLHSERDSIPDAAAVYFVVPSDENIIRICSDLRNHLYDHYYLNFITPISHQKIEDLALACLEADATKVIKKVMDQYLDFISLEDDMFILRQNSKEEVSYYAINRADVQETEMEEVMTKICDGLFALLATLEVVPIIRCAKGNAAEMVAEKLNKRLRENLQDVKNNLFKGSSFTDLSEQRPLTFQRPLLIILDRNMDMATPLHHTWTYQALIHDVLSFKLNRVTITESSDESVAVSSSRKKTQTFDLNSDDEFWQRHKITPFPQVAKSVQEELEAYKNSEEEVKRLRNNMDSENSMDLLSNNTAKLTSAVQSLPELLKKKSLIDMHTTIATSILDQIKKRKLDNFFELEEKILSKSILDKTPLEIIKDAETGSESDKVRLCLINFLCSSLSDDEINQYEKALEEANCDLNAFRYLRRWKTFSRMPTLANVQYGGGTKTVNMFSKLMTQGSQFVMEGVKNLVLKKQTLPITRIVSALMEMKNLQEIEDYRYFDPKLSKVSDNRIPETRTSFQDAIVFVVGGGNYIEYQNLVEYCKSKTGKPNPKRVIYGCTDLVNADQFIEQLSRLGQELQR
ncbi:sec1 family domain-containing protein 1-like isoform X2 [Panonychus citri]|uniref:sec1 family domain-containing protein 1-like isoform X2 n=1 Tax=Panonychus citri TaxID=50023 RepID=UPI002307B37F|nr:sec1 family domain-containing protein 1-like isoform X2 [Panonychus citri]